MEPGTYRSILLVGIFLGLGLGTIGCSGDDDPTTTPCILTEQDVAGIWYYCEDCILTGLQPQSKIDFDASGDLTFELPEQECNPLDGSGVSRISTGTWTLDGCSITFSVTSAPPPDDQACSVNEGVGSIEIVFIDPLDRMVIRTGEDTLLRRRLTDLECYCAN